MYVERPPAPPLATVVRAAWASDGDRAASTVRPDGCTDLIFHQTPQGRLVLSVVGVMTVPLHVQGDGRNVALRLHPHAAGALLREAGAYRDASVSADGIWGRPARELQEQLAELPDREAHWAMQAFVRARLGPTDARITYAAGQLEAGGARIDALAADLNLSSRQLSRLFERHVGISPRMLARTFRLERTLPLLRDAALSLADIAVLAGYADQAHLTRECVALTGETPRVWRVRNLQDAVQAGAAD